MIRLPFYKKIVFKAAFAITIVLGLSFSISYIVTTNYANHIINKSISKEFSNAINVTENFITFIGQTSQIWARHTVLDNNLHKKIEQRDFNGIKELLSIEKNEMSADSIILLDSKGNVLSQVGGDYQPMDSLASQDIVKETFSSKSPVTKILREKESFIVYSSSLIEKDNKILGMVLMGYFINDIFLENIKVNTKLDIAIVGNSAIMCSTKWGDDNELDFLPFDFIKYQSLLQNPDNFQIINHLGKNFIITAKNLKNIDSSISGSVLVGHAAEDIEILRNDIFYNTLVLFSVVFIITLLILLYLSKKVILSINILKNSTLKIASGNLRSRVNIQTNDEFEILADNFNKMIEAVELKNKQLEEYTHNLEEEVQRRTDELVQREKILFQQSKMAAMGEMLSNIAHQWRQPLSTISTAASGIKLQHEFGNFNDKEFKKSMDEIVSTTQHLSHTIDDFRNFFNESKEKTKFNLENLMESCLELLIRSMKQNKIEVITNIDKNTYIVGYKRELMQALLNILNNAIDVLKEQNINMNRFIFIDIQEDGDHATINIKDNGGGISDNIIDKIYEPYFTTKHQSQGTGLGLHMTYKIINNNLQGSINAKNVEYTYNNIICKGVDFTIKLPKTTGL